MVAVSLAGEDAPGGEDAHVVCVCCGERTKKYLLEGSLRRSKVMKGKDKARGKAERRQQQY